MLYLIIVVVSFVGALIQGVTGFGSSLTIMTLLPYFMALPQAVAISCVIPLAQMAAFGLALSCVAELAAHFDTVGVLSRRLLADDPQCFIF